MQATRPWLVAVLGGAASRTSVVAKLGKGEEKSGGSVADAREAAATELMASERR